MASNSTLLCIHRDPSQLSLLKQHGYELVTATTGSDGLRLFVARSVDAIVLDYQLGFLDGAVVASVIKKVKPQVPIIMLTENVELPDDALQCVDALVAKSDGPHFLLETLHFVLNVRPAQRHGKLRPATPIHLRRPGRSRQRTGTQDNPPQLAIDVNGAPFSPKVWKSIRDGIDQSEPTSRKVRNA